MKAQINAQIAAHQAELQQHQANALQCMGAIRGLEVLLKSLERAEKDASEAGTDATVDPQAPYVPASDLDYHG